MGGLFKMKKSNKSEKRKLEIIEASKNLFVEKTFDKTTVNDILDSTGLSKGGFYHYFKSKADVLTTIIDQLVVEVVQETNVIANSSEINALQKLKLFIQKSYQKKLPYTSLLKSLSKGKGNNLLLFRYYTGVWERYLPPLISIVRQGVNEGSMIVENVEETVRILYKALTFVHEIDNKMLKDKDQIYRHLVALEQIIIRTLGIEDGINIDLVTREVILAIMQLKQSEDEDSEQERSYIKTPKI